MPKNRRWKNSDLIRESKKVTSIRQLISRLGLIPAGGNYEQIKKYINDLKIDISHFKGSAWNKGLKYTKTPMYSIDEILVENSSFQSYKLKRRLFDLNLKKPECELCGWATISPDHRLPLELDHINGNRRDNRFENLRILCPNCHSLQPTHRARNMKKFVNK